MPISESSRLVRGCMAGCELVHELRRRKETSSLRREFPLQNQSAGLITEHKVISDKA